MGAQVSYDTKNTDTRIQLSVKALKKLIGHLRPDDSISVSEFKCEARVILPQTTVSKIDMEDYIKKIDKLEASSGNTINAGMNCAMKQLGSLPEDKTRERRILFMTDMHEGEYSGDDLQVRMAEAAKKGWYTSIIGLGVSYNTKMTERITKEKGSNYYCATKVDDFQKILVDDFHYNFFPCAFDADIQIKSGDFRVEGLYGTPYDIYEEKDKEMKHVFEKTHQFYPKEFREMLVAVDSVCDGFTLPVISTIGDFVMQPEVTVSEINSLFSSDADLETGTTEGGLILLKCVPKAAGITEGSIKIVVKSTDLEGNKDIYEKNIQVDLKNGLEKGSSLHKGVVLQQYVEHSRKVIETEKDVKMEYVDAYLKQLT
eukprot:UN29882